MLEHNEAKAASHWPKENIMQSRYGVGVRVRRHAWLTAHMECIAMPVFLSLLMFPKDLFT